MIYEIGHPMERYFSGDCPVFAVALHRMTGYPLAALVENIEDQGDVLIHAFVLLGTAEEILDAGGESSVADVLAEFPNSGNARVALLTETELFQIGYNKSNINIGEDVLSDVRTMLQLHGIDLTDQALQPSQSSIIC